MEENKQQKYAEKLGTKFPTKQEGLKGIKNFDDEVSYYRYYLKECESVNIKLIEKVEELQKEIEGLKIVLEAERGFSHERIEELQSRIGKVLDQCAVNWITNILKGE